MCVWGDWEICPPLFLLPFSLFPFFFLSFSFSCLPFLSVFFSLLITLCFSIKNYLKLLQFDLPLSMTFIIKYQFKDHLMYQSVFQPQLRSLVPWHSITNTCSVVGSHTLQPIHPIECMPCKARTATLALNKCSIWWYVTLSHPRRSQQKANAGTAPRDTYLQLAAYGLRPIKMQSPH